MKKSLLFSALLMLSAVARAQYPTIPDSVKVRATEQQAQWSMQDEAVWQEALPMVTQEMLDGRPFVPWASKPEMLKQAQIPAFPGAIGGGRYSFGGRGGRIYVVANLADSGEGSLREACEAGGARIIVFNVAGEIHLERPIHIKAPYISIYGQTAPGNGVVITGQSVLIDTHDVVIRYMRFRRGATDVAFRDDACGGNGIGNIIFDHCSVSWGLDEVMSIYRHVYNRDETGRGTKLPTVNITIQDCIFAEGLDLYNHGFGASIGGHNTLFARNLFANNISRNPSIAMDGDFNFVNNVLFNWWNRSIDGGDENSEYNIINNYLKPGPVTGYDVKKGEANENASIRWRILKPEAGRSKEHSNRYGKAYVNGNIIEGNNDVTIDNWAGGVQPDGKSDNQALLDSIKAEAPFAMPYIDTIYSAGDAYIRMLKEVGATKPARDAVDTRIIRSVQKGQPEYAKDAKVHTSPYVTRRLPDDSFKMGIITDPQQVGGLPIYKGKPRKDSDGDGIPDYWEKKHGLNPQDPTDATLIREDGYMNIEWYANSL